ncbi:MAG TPA: alpha/beta fold hydrolase [Kiritimatiellia bacterium]|nr:alpha/beta fold hydrolase [Kiritimatiellia bacterium]
MKKWLKRLAILLLAFFIILNYLAFRHSRTFFFYSDGGKRTPAPEELTFKQKINVMITGIHVPKPKAHSSPHEHGMPFVKITIPGRNQIPLSAWKIPGSSDTEVLVIMFHGYSSEKSGLLTEAQIFHELGYMLLMVDFPGSGGTPGNKTTLGIKESEDVAAVLAWARSVWPKHQIVLYGHSMGAAAIMRSVAVHEIHPDAVIIESAFDTLLNAIRLRFHLMNIPSFPAAEILLFWGSVQLGANGFSHDVRMYARNVNVPVFMIHGMHDNRASLQGANDVFSQLKGDRELMVMEKAGHVSPCTDDREKWKNGVRTFIQDQSGSQRDKNTP